MKGKTEKILCGFSSIFPKYLGKYARKMRAGRYETGSEGKFASRWRAKSPDALCAVLPQAFSGILFTWIEKSVQDTGAVFTWGVNRFSEMQNLAQGFHSVKDDNILRGMAKLYPAYRLISWLPVVKNMAEKILIFQKD